MKKKMFFAIPLLVFVMFRIFFFFWQRSEFVYAGNSDMLKLIIIWLSWFPPILSWMTRTSKNQVGASSNVSRHHYYLNLLAG